ncbi:X2-like carbohydrate binding domain-containing protein [Paenibacillus sp. 843]|uniref:X2-like carbohydrate binding domain-containing protein n=1 Tax=Paenibacillus sp. 843 TaxID=3341795 RepID=UPI003729A6BB
MKKKKSVLLMLLAVLLVAAQTHFVPLQTSLVHAAGNDLASKPYMGWSSYSLQVYHTGSWITADHIKAQSDAMHEKLQPYGYNYINVDAGWNGSMDEYGRPVPSTTLYPDGLQDVIDYVHANGQKFGLYLIPGLSPQAYEDNLQIYGTTCRMQEIAAQPLQKSDYWGLGYKIDFSNPCAQKYIDSIADQLGEWGVNFIKFDSVTPGSGISDLSMDARDDVKAWSQALKRHNIWLELSWALDINYVDYWKEYADGWRVDWDIECYCGSEALTTWPSIARLFPKAEQWWRHAGPEGWNDFDSLNVGNGEMDGLTKDERQSAMTFWAISSAPLYIGDDMTKLDDYGIELLTNEEVIAVNQAGRPAHPISTESDQQVWYANNGDGSYTVGLFNLGDKSAEVVVDWKAIGLEGAASVRDLWSHTELGIFQDGYRVELPSHGSRLFRVSAQDGWVAVNDDDTGMRYSGNWSRNRGLELAADMQNLVIDVVDAKVNGSTIYPSMASFDKMASEQKDVEVTVDWNDNHEISRISNGGHDLVPLTDYTVNGNSVSIHKAYLAKLPVGTTNLTFTFPAGAAQQLVLTIQDTTVQDSRVYPPVISFDRNERLASDRTDSHLAIAWNGNTLSAVTNGNTTLESGTDYTVSGNQMLLKKAYLASLPVGMSELGFTFTNGKAQRITIAVRDTSSGGVISLNDDDPNIKYTGAWNRSYNRGLGDYRDDVHFAEKDGEQFEYTFQGTGVELVTELDPSQGEMDIYVDETFVQTVDTSNAGRLAQQTVYHLSGLENGTHTVKAVKKSGTFMLLDQIRILVPDLITPSAVRYDKAGSAQGDISVTADTYGHTLSRITNGQIELVKDKEYTVSDQQVLLKKSYLEAQPIGMSELLFSFSGEASQTLALTVEDSAAQNSLLDMMEVSFDKNEATQQDIAVEVVWNGNTLTGVSQRGNDLDSGTDYSVKDNQIVLSKTYLAAQPVGQSYLKFSFSGGAPQTLVIEIRDTTPPNSTIMPNLGSFDKNADAQNVVTTTMELNGNQLASIIHESSELEAGTDYIVSGNEVTILTPFLEQLPLGTAKLELGFSSGKPQELAVVVIDTSRGRYATVNDDDPAVKYVGAWQHNRNRGLGDYKDDVHFTEKNGDYYEFKFKGTGIEIITEKDNAQGDMDIYVDGEFQQTISTYAAEKRVQQSVYHIAGLPDGEHTVKVVKKSGYYMLLDRLKYRVADLIGPDSAVFNKSGGKQKDIEISLHIDDTNLLAIRHGSTVLKEGKDYSVSGEKVRIKKSYLAKAPTGTNVFEFQFRGDYLNDVNATGQNGDYFEYTFQGTGVELLTPKGPDQGKIDLYVDGKFMKTINAHHDSRQTIQSVYRLNGLKEGTHTIKGIKRSGTWMIVDQLKFKVL